MKERRTPTYRWNDDLQRVEFWDRYHWSFSIYSDRVGIAGIAIMGYDVVTYDDTWCEPTEDV